MLAQPKYKICKRLGSGVYEKCQTQKFALSEARAKKTFKRRRTLSDYGRQLIEKQKVRFAYGITEQQMRKYVAEATKSTGPASTLFTRLETRLDNIVYRLGFAPTRRSARQMVNHGHIMVNGKKMNIPSHAVLKGDVVSVRPQSAEKTLFTANSDRIASHTAPAWIAKDAKKLSGTIKGMPDVSMLDSSFDLAAVFEYYSR